MTNIGVDDFLYGDLVSGFIAGAVILPPISKVKIGSGATYEIKDTVARQLIKDYGRKETVYYHEQVVNVANNAEIMRITNASITPNTIVLDCIFSDKGSISPDVTWTSYDGYITFNGTCRGAQTANVTLVN